MADQLSGVDDERELLVRCIEDAYESLRLIPGVDESGPALIWMADHLWEAYSRSHPPAETR
jgi:hypothetical protein